jgi:cation:H+ antiporter
MAFLYIYYAIWSAGQGDGGIVERIKIIQKTHADKEEVVKQFFYLVLGLILLIIGARFLVNSGIGIAKYFGVNDIIIGITIITVGTAMPEIWTSLTALVKKSAEISLGNVIGSTVFNIFVIFGIVLVISRSPIIVPISIINFDLLFLILLTLILVTLLRTSDRIARFEGVILLVSYFSYIIYLIYISKFAF